jgi:hypothetical protein
MHPLDSLVHTQRPSFDLLIWHARDFGVASWFQKNRLAWLHCVSMKRGEGPFFRCHWHGTESVIKSSAGVVASCFRAHWMCDCFRCH